jgi:putative membrane protein
LPFGLHIFGFYNYFAAMVTYNPKEWFKPLIQFHKADTFRKLLPLLVTIGLYTAAVVLIGTRYIKQDDYPYLQNIPLMHTLLGFVISLLLVFRTNTAYDRWWEGRKLWGNLVNTSRNLAVKLDSMLSQEDQENRNYFSKLIALFAKELQHHLQKEQTRLELDSKPHPEIPGFDRSRHVPSQIISHMHRRINHLLKTGQLTMEQLLFINPELISFLDICGACERIKNTPIPYSYTTFLKKFIFIYVLTLPLGYVFALGYITIPVVIFIFYVLASLEVIAEEIEDPFGLDTNDLPMERLAIMIGKNVTEILQ